MEVGGGRNRSTLRPTATGGLLERRDDPAGDEQVGQHPFLTGGLSAFPLRRRSPGRTSTGARQRRHTDDQ